MIFAEGGRSLREKKKKGDPRAPADVRAQAPLAVRSKKKGICI